MHKLVFKPEVTTMSLKTLDNNNHWYSGQEVLYYSPLSGVLTETWKDHAMSETELS